MNMRRLSRLIAPIALMAPSVVLASSTTDLISELAGLFYIIVGLTLVASFLFMMAGFAMWCIRLGTFPTYRDDGIKMMEWGVATLFTLILVLGVVEFIQWHTETVLYILGLLIIVLVIWLIATSGVLSGGGHEKEEE